MNKEEATNILIEASYKTICHSYCWTLKVLNWKMAILIQVESMLCTRSLSLYRWINAWLPLLVSDISNLQHKLQFCMYVWVGPTFLGEYIVSYTITAQLYMISFLIAVVWLPWTPFLNCYLLQWTSHSRPLIILWPMYWKMSICF